MLRLLGALTVLSLGFGCATSSSAQKGAEAPSSEAAAPAAPAPAAESAEAQQAQLKAMFERELPAELPSQTIQLARQGYPVLAAKPVEVSPGDDGYDFYTLSLGTEQPVQCFVYRQPMNAGAVLNQVVESVSKAVTVQAMAPSGVKLAGKDPAVFLDVIYLSTNAAGQKAMGQLKLMSLGGNASALCMHDEPGYSKTFEKVSLSLATALSKAHEGPTPLYREVAVVSLQGLAVGFNTTEVRAGKGKERIYQEDSTVLLPRTRTDLVAQDDSLVLNTDANGWVKGGQDSQYENGELKTRLSISRGKGATYQVEGTYAGKELKGTLVSPNKSGLASDLVVRRQLLDQLLPGKVKELQFPEFHGHNPLEATLVTYRQGSATRVVTAEMKGMSMESTLDAQGMSEKTTAKIGPANLELTRIFSEGSL